MNNVNVSEMERDLALEIPGFTSGSTASSRSRAFVAIAAEKDWEEMMLLRDQSKVIGSVKDDENIGRKSLSCLMKWREFEEVEIH